MTSGEPTAEDRRRDLAADLATCDAATGGDWFAWVREEVPASMGGQPYGNVQGPRRVCVDRAELFAPADAVFMAAARYGWPAAIRRLMWAEAILDAPRVALFADGREPTTNERHLLNLLEWRAKEAAEAKAEVARLQGIIDGLAARVAGQSELLSRRAENPP